MKIEEVIRLYIKTFNEGPPIIGMEEDEAIETGKIIEQGAEENIPNGALL